MNHYYMNLYETRLDPLTNFALPHRITFGNRMHWRTSYLGVELKMPGLLINSWPSGIFECDSYLIEQLFKLQFPQLQFPRDIEDTHVEHPRGGCCVCC